MKTLIHWYHLVSFDLALTFVKLGHDVTVSIDTSVSDHYGSHLEMMQKAQKDYPEFKIIPYQQALVQIKQFDLVGLDGVSKGDQGLIQLCLKHHIPYFCISGYPHVKDEPSQNILSFSWFLPHHQYHNRFPTEHHIKMGDWKHIAETGQSEGKNVLMFYPNFWRLKEWLKDRNLNTSLREGYVSCIHRFEECNPENYKVFKQIQNELNLVNWSQLSQEQMWHQLWCAEAFIHMKHGDCPGIALIEAMLCGAIPFVMKSFVLASNNHDLLVDGYSAIVCDEVNEIIGYGQQIPINLRLNSRIHAEMLTSFDRQKEKLKSFADRCVK